MKKEMSQSEVINRFQKLEKKIRIQKYSFSFLVVTILTIFLLGGAWDEPEEVIAKKFVLVSEEGEPRALIFFDEDGFPNFSLFDRNGAKRISLRVWDDGEPEITLLDSEEVPLLELELSNGNLPWIEMRSEEDVEVVSLGLNSYGAPSLEMSSADEKRNMDLRFDEEGFFGVAFYSPDYDDRLRVGISKEGDPQIEFLNEKERPQITLMYSDKNGLPLFEMKDNLGTKVVSFPEKSK